MKISQIAYIAGGFLSAAVFLVILTRDHDHRNPPVELQSTAARPADNAVVPEVTKQRITQSADSVPTPGDESKHSHRIPPGEIQSSITPPKSNAPTHRPAKASMEGAIQPAASNPVPGHASFRTKHGIRSQISQLSTVKDGTSITSNSPATSRKPWRPAPQEVSIVPASFIEITPTVPLPDGAGEFLGELAEDFKNKLEDSGLSPEEPEYKSLWESEAFLNDIRFKTTYGNAQWLQHHNASLETGIH